MINKQRAQDILLEIDRQLREADMEASAQLRDLLTESEYAWLLNEEEETQKGKAAPYTLFGILENISEGKGY